MPARAGTVDRLFLDLYCTVVRHPQHGEVWNELTEGLARLLELPLVMVGHYGAHGTLGILATSRESALWWDLHRVPERWDGSLVGRGLAALALGDESPATLDLHDERFVCWREGADRDRLRSGCAVRVRSRLGEHLLQFFAPRADAFDDDLKTLLLELGERTQRLLDDLALLREQKLLSSALEHAGNAAFITDREGTIVWCNRAFSRMYGYTRDEAVGQNPRFLSSGRQGVRYYRDLWSTIRSGRVWAGETVDRDRSGVAYTVRQTITPFSWNDEQSHFLAVHDDISAEYAQRLRSQLRDGIDAVTGLMTRAAFEERLTQATADDGREWTLMLVSLREFHDGVRALGGRVADSVAAEIGQRLREALGGDVPAAAMDPGEYAVQIAHDGAIDTTALVKSLEAALARPFGHLSAALIARPRVAVAHFPADGRSFDALMHHADQQLADRPVSRARR
ncbi:PAS domain S-box protein [Fontimonas sp. SYSU GA230001]|uniref:PAS domain S-box protein n=1 Tax=Fontimonas sp. SYSU GA230001 TaxID=3142450 RepID=UPI0032B5A2D6